ncbi:glycosyl transferase [Caloranaerobacter sp. TR13]|uniref:GH36-type glycosyl hydrolase domain-containing protein n=1 Tax=Caloranaerobacter sp. TR13 TaxID=1302151 RepID=UPI0006D4560B|nr:glucoamylase family protein [Caloranaerobacter sp. TR13]KPU27792.1 glycosyl transferase [Caloranaerobacter sp. TR13]
MSVAFTLLAVVIFIIIFAEKKQRLVKKVSVKDILLSPEELEGHIIEVAKMHNVSSRKKANKLLLHRLEDNFRYISKLYERLNLDFKRGKEVSYASEWLLDNFYIIKQQYKEMKKRLRNDKYMVLEVLADGYLKGYPRIYAVALEIISHTDGRLDENQLIKYINKYQTKKILSIGEIWSLSVMIRLALIEFIRIICEKIEKTHNDWEKVNNLMYKKHGDLVRILEDYLDGINELSPSFFEYFIRKVKRTKKDEGEIREFLNKILLDINKNLDVIIKDEHTEQSARRISMGNAILSLKLISTIDWNEIFESISVVENVLKKDPSGIYPKMDYESRDFYRREIQYISRLCNISELIVARRTLELSEVADIDDEKRRHIGYYIIDKGRDDLFKTLGEKGTNGFKSKSIFVYITPILLLTLLITVMLVFYHYNTSERKSTILSVLAGIVISIPVSNIIVMCMNWLITHTIKPTFLPKIDIKRNIPEELSTLVIIPTLVSNKEMITELTSKLEVFYLANRLNNIYFAIVADFKDSDFEKEIYDDEILEKAKYEIDKLNKKYAAEKDIFYYLHRKRQFNEKQNRWMGWERKRGALVELNKLLKGADDTSFFYTVGNIENLIGKIKYVITIDSDTKLPLETAKKLIGTISHPLNRAVFDEKSGIVKQGYGIIQPRINVDIESSNSSSFANIFSGQVGLEPYITAFSDVYQDLFNEGIFTGKGIYEVEIFNKALRDAIPDNTVLSHDLLEGSYLRTGLATDIELIDGYPIKYSSYIMRLHRWVRGDWQLISWLLPKIRDRKGNIIHNPISTLSKWKILDNLRRSLVPIFTLILIIISIAFFPGNKLIWLGLAGLSLTVQLFLGLLDYLLNGYLEFGKKFNQGLTSDIKRNFYQTFYRFVFLPYEAYVMLDAIVRTLWRMVITKRNLLEWTTATDVEKRLANDFFSYIKRMYKAVLITILFLVLTIFVRPENTIISAVITISWVLSPYLAYKLSTIESNSIDDINEVDEKKLRRIARKTWAYYDDFADVENNYLPPDNYQEYPPNGLAYRTSPTNIGFLLLSILTARDLGYISTIEMLNRIDKTLTTVEKLETWNGHLYNWYNTRTLEPLRPYFVSTVDSGNFIAYLITVKQGLLYYLNKPLIDINYVKGLLDTVYIYEQRDNILIPILLELKDEENLTYSKWNDILEQLLSLREEENLSLRLINMLKYFNEESRSLYVDRKHIESLFKQFLDNNKEISSSFQRLKELEKYSMLQLEDIYRNLIKEINIFIDSSFLDENRETLFDIKEELSRTYENVLILIDKAKSLVNRIEKIIDNTKFKPLYDYRRNLFAIGYNVSEKHLTTTFYDLLASEARTTSYIAIVKGEIPRKHWVKLSRSLTVVDGFRSLISWTGTMFEYFMPALIMKTYKNTLLHETYHTALKAQMKYGLLRGIPWGISESGYYTFDMHFNYQYRAFGVPCLGFKRGLVEDIVVSPYSTFLALIFNKKETLKNMDMLIEEGLEGEYGFYEAVDYTEKRIPFGIEKGIVKSYMAHHQGMILTSINNLLNNNIIISYFHSEPMIKAGEILLQEKVPQYAIITNENEEEIESKRRVRTKNRIFIRQFEMPERTLPKCHLISNGRYTILITNTGCGYSKYENIQITRWREDLLTGDYGFFILIKSLKDNKVWSTTYRPFYKEPDEYKVEFEYNKAKFFRKDDDIETRTEIITSSDDNVEIRTVTITNHNTKEVTLEVTSYLESIISQHMADIAHPAFNNLFIRTEIIPQYDSIIASRRPREHGNKSIWAFHSVLVDGESIGGLQYETNRTSFIGRCRSLKNARSLDQPLSNTTGIVLDPIMSLRRLVKIKSGESIKISFIVGVGNSRKEVVELVRKYHDIYSISRAFQLSDLRSQVETSYLGLENEEFDTYEELLSHIVYLSPLRRDDEEKISKNRKGQSGLWSYGISGDIPILLVTINDEQQIDVLREALKMHEFFRIKGLEVDLVILNEYESSYIKPLENLIRDTVLNSRSKDMINRRGGIFILNASHMVNEDKILLYTVARVVLKGERGLLRVQINRNIGKVNYPKEKIFNENNVIFINKDEEDFDLFYFNGYGGFTKDGSEYVIKLKENQYTPAPWINVIANKKFGFLVTESGSGFVWSENSRENKITPWSNDPVSDTPGEVIYLRDEETGKVWSITPLPIRESEAYTIIHGIGYSKFKHNSNGIKQELTVFVPKEDSVKISLIKLKNNSGFSRKLTLTYYVRPVLGVSDQITQQHIITEIENETGTLIIKNPYNTDFPDRITFINTSQSARSYTGDREEFIGYKGDLSSPEALKREGLSNTVGAGFDPCAVIQTIVDLDDGEEKELVFMLGQYDNLDDIKDAVHKYKNINKCKEALKEVKSKWQSILGAIKVKTPDKSMDIMLNYWLLYQTISCRLWGRSAFYQSGGAYGFRDQLQDAMNSIYAIEEDVRKQILLHCSHQFVEGDVQHWWHPTASANVDKGIRTKFSDDLLWLPLATVEYINKTGDFKILDEKVRFIESEPLKEYEDERYEIPRASNEISTVYEHCIRAIEKSLKFGKHGIPLMGSGDWNDGMNKVGNKGKGESIWLGWFICSILNKFAPICQKKGDDKKAERYLEEAKKIAKAIEDNAWDGKWYRRAYFDNGTPLGSFENTECKIDSLAQSWAVISGYGNKERVKVAMASVERYLIKEDQGLILLFTPPFDKSELDPGYIKGYVPGVRENGGQYTHAATWVVNAFAMMGDGDKAWRLYNMINPVNHTRTSIECVTYKVEPYVMAADVYAVSPHIGRGGWTWYTGAAGWMYRVGIEYILGLKKEADKLIIDPCIPKNWFEYEIEYRYKDTIYNIKVTNPNKVNRGVGNIYIDGNIVKEKFIHLVNDNRKHLVEVILG